MLKSINKSSVLEKSMNWWNPGRTRKWQNDGIDLVVGKREGYYFYDIDGKQLMDMHLNGGTYNLGHRNPEIVATLKEALDEFDAGNHHFPSIARALLAEEVAACTPKSLKYSIFSPSGSEANDVAVKCARYTTKRKKMISLEYGYHGNTGVTTALGNERFSRPFLSEGNPNEFVHVPYNDLGVMERELSKGDVAGVIMETIPATYGFPIPEKGYLSTIKQMCEKYGTLYIADEVQTGLMRSGKLWAIEHYGVDPDILVSAKGFGGGIYPSAVTVVSEKAGQWLQDSDKYSTDHYSTFGGSELACIVSMKVLEISQRPEVRENVDYVGRYLRSGYETIRKQYPQVFTGIRQLGIIMGLEFSQPEVAKQVMRTLYKNGVWAIYSMLDPKVLQLKPGLLLDKGFCDELLSRSEQSIKEVAQTASLTV